MEICSFCKSHKREKYLSKPCDGMLNSRQIGELAGLSSNVIALHTRYGYIHPNYKCYKTEGGGFRTTKEEVQRYLADKSPRKTCDVCGKVLDGKTCLYTNGYRVCGKHYHQFLDNGKFLDSNARSLQDLNSYEVLGDITKVDLYDLKSNVVGHFYIDTADFNKIKNTKWHLAGDKRNIVSNKIPYNGGFINGRLSWVIMDFPKEVLNGEKVIDHIDNQPMNNRKSNLRVIEQAKNCQNTTRRSDNKSGVKGASWRDHANAYCLSIKRDGEQIFCGYYKTIEEAAYARNVAELFVHPDYYCKREHQKNYSLYKFLDPRKKEKVKEKVMKKLIAKSYISDISLANHLIEQDEQQMKRLLGA